MPRYKEKAPPSEGQLVEISEDHFLHVCYLLIEQLLTEASALENEADKRQKQVEAIRNTMEAIELSKQTGHYLSFYQSEDGAISYQAKEKPRLGFLKD